MNARMTAFVVLGVTAMTVAGLRLQGQGGASSGKWLGFTAYPGVRDLCDEVVRGQSEKGPVEIHWRSFASRDATADVIAFYAKREGKNARRSTDSIEIRRDADYILSAYPASRTGVPSCSVKANSEEKTIIVVSVRR